MAREEKEARLLRALPGKDDKGSQDGREGVALGLVKRTRRKGTASAGGKGYVGLLSSLILLLFFSLSC
jgi:hypothetical protein